MVDVNSKGLLESYPSPTKAAPQTIAAQPNNFWSENFSFKKSTPMPAADNVLVSRSADTAPI